MVCDTEYTDVAEQRTIPGKGRGRGRASVSVCTGAGHGSLLGADIFVALVSQAQAVGGAVGVVVKGEGLGILDVLGQESGAVTTDVLVVGGRLEVKGVVIDIVVD